jgi:4-amino-4-deoxy-L-arabinose transferase-like glycosyltransferase
MKWMSRQGIPLSTALFWILSLSCVAVGTRNFEDGGITVDGPLYASIARRIAETGEWFSLYGGTPDLKPFYEHPHLGFWFIASVFKVLGAADWTARIPGHLFYFGFLTVFFLFIRSKSGQKTAIWAVLLLWSFARVSNFFSNVFLDPGAVFFGTLGLFLWWEGLEKGKALWTVLAGVSLALCFMVKGMTVLGFGPAFALVAVYHPRTSLRATGVAFGGAVLCLLVYAVMLHFSNEPSFLYSYFDLQALRRVGGTWLWSGIFRPQFWHSVLIDSNYLAPLALVAITRLKRLDTLVPVLLFLTFSTMYSCAGLNGGQYNITLLPWIAWLVGQELSKWKWNPLPLVRVSTGIALAAVFIIQYIPTRTHGSFPPPETPLIRQLIREGALKELYVDVYPERAHFGYAGAYAWYGGIDLNYADATHVPDVANTRYLVLIGNHPDRRTSLVKYGWCVKLDSGASSLWGPCSH